MSMKKEAIKKSLKKTPIQVLVFLAFIFILDYVALYHYDKSNLQYTIIGNFFMIFTMNYFRFLKRLREDTGDDK